MKKVMTVLAVALFLGACHCTKCTTHPKRSNTCKSVCACQHPKQGCKNAACKQGCKCNKPAPKFAEAAKPLPPAPKPAPKVQAEDFDKVAVVKQQAANKVVLNFKEPINFKYNSDEISADSLENIQKVADALKKYPNATVRAAGYTDSLGNETYNLDLSQRRAKAVALQLVRDGVKAENVSFVGYGVANPIATNKTSAGRAQNRRVELEVTNK
jgi:outer membrane protein OmpA-like peptidoglycan-associated protein